MSKKRSFTALWSSALFFLIASIAWSQETTKEALIQEAKKEKVLSLYSSLAAQDADAFIKRFEKKYPFIRVNLYRAGNVKLLTRLTMEGAANKVQNDVVICTGDITHILQTKGLLARYLSPERKFFPEKFKDKEGYWTDVFPTVHTIVYNTALIPPQEVPKQLKELLDPKWKGKIIVNLNNYQWVGEIIDIFGKKEAMAFFDGLARQNPVAREGGSLTALLVAAKEFHIGMSVNANNVLNVKEQGGPVDWMRLKEPLYGDLHPVSVMKAAAHPNAARLFVDFALSQEGQEMIASFGKVAPRLGVKNKIANIEDLTPNNITVAAENAVYHQKVLRDLVVRR